MTSLQKRMRDSHTFPRLRNVLEALIPALKDFQNTRCRHHLHFTISASTPTHINIGSSNFSSSRLHQLKRQFLSPQVLLRIDHSGKQLYSPSAAGPELESDHEQQHRN
eukprot:TRINITY_DN1146_c0_g2_i1.p2 TRINITY_DN1146_c0_g2~~TRINITY_DN1146_c0_g2_i1.p2  ORF type:complete len:108 (-),score=4.33 TRINITY_DN1146_c0_g2_i1:68-391(-)